MGTDSDLEEEEFTTELEPSNISLVSTELSTNRRVQVKQSPFLDIFYKHFPIRVTIDSGAKTNLIKSLLVQRIGACLNPSAPKALQAYRSTPLNVRGETTNILQQDNLELQLNALVVDEIDVDVLAGIPFMTTNDIAVWPAKHQVIIGDKKICKYERTRAGDNTSTVRRAQSYLVRAPNSTTTLWPNEFLELTVPDSLDEYVAIEPRCDSQLARDGIVAWPSPTVVRRFGDKIRIPNHTLSPIRIKRHDHLCQVVNTVALVYIIHPTSVTTGLQLHLTHHHNPSSWLMLTKNMCLRNSNRSSGHFTESFILCLIVHGSLGIMDKLVTLKPQSIWDQSSHFNARDASPSTPERSYLNYRTSLMNFSPSAFSADLRSKG